MQIDTITKLLDLPNFKVSNWNSDIRPLCFIN